MTKIDNIEEAQRLVGKTVRFNCLSGRLADFGFCCGFKAVLIDAAEKRGRLQLTFDLAVYEEVNKAHETCEWYNPKTQEHDLTWHESGEYPVDNRDVEWLEYGEMPFDVVEPSEKSVFDGVSDEDLIAEIRRRKLIVCTVSEHTLK